MNVDELFDDVRVELDDVNKNHYTDAMLVVPYNRIYTALNFHIVRIGAEIGMKTGTISTDGTNSSFDLPADFMAFVEDHFLPRNPVTATSEYTHARALPQLPPSHRDIITSVITEDVNRNQTTTATASTPSAFYLSVSGTSQSVGFNTTPPDGQYYDYWYWPKISRVTASAAPNTATPFLGMIDSVLHYSLVAWCRDHREFTPALEGTWLAHAMDDSMTILGIRHLQERDPKPSLWRNYPQ